MTTIAFKDGVMVGDGRTTVSNTIVEDTAVKVHKSGHYLIGFAGSAACETRYNRAPNLLEMQKNLDEESYYLVFDKSKQELCELSHQGVFKITSEYYAIGSGMDFALAAMDTGASAREAVEIACQRDVYSGGLITEVK